MEDRGEAGADDEEAGEDGVAAKRKKRKKTYKPGSLEKYKSLKVSRKKLVNADYNPRVITDDERSRLKEGMERHGLVMPPVWNKRTGNIVGGHQRVSVLDDLYGTDDYELTVAVVDVDDVREKELNLLLNNGLAQGDFDLLKLEELFRSTPTMKVEGTGFDSAELFRMFGANPFVEGGSAEDMSEVAERIRAFRERQKTMNAKLATRDDEDFYLVVVFKDTADRDAFCDQVGWEQNRYQDGRALRTMCADHIATRATKEKIKAKAKERPDLTLASDAARKDDPTEEAPSTARARRKRA